MAVMHVPQHQPADWPDEPDASAAIEDLRDLRERVKVGKRHIEIIEGRLVVSPVPLLWHELVCVWLLRSFLDVSDAKGWFTDSAGEIKLTPTEDLIEPDLMILRDVASLRNLRKTRPLDHVLLVAEVISRSSIRDDRQVKPHACALAGVPLYLLADRFTKPITISLFSEPGESGYTKIETVNVGQKLSIPAPFDIALDTSTLPLPN
jgi:Uma2 family endonuclease